MDKILSCPICLGRFRDPKQLPCGHTFCAACLDGLVEKFRLRCPECREYHEVPRVGVRGFSCNWTVKRLIESSSGDISCQGCSKKNCLVGKCSHCQHTLCRACLIKHSSLLNDELGAAMSKVQEQMSKISMSISKVRNQQQSAKRNETTVINAIGQWAERGIQQINMKKQSMVEEMKKFTAEEIRILQSSQESLELELAKMSSFVVAADKIRSATGSKISDQQESLRKTLEQSKEYVARLHVEPTVERQATFNSEEANAILVSLNSMHGIHVSRTDLRQGDPHKSTAPAAGIVRTGIAEPLSTGASSKTPENRAILEKYQKAGRAKRYFGRKGNGEGCLKLPWGVVSTENGNTIVTEYGNDRLQIFDTLGNSLDIIGESGSEDGEFNNPFGICTIPSSRCLVVADTRNDRIQIFDATGRFITKFSGIGKGTLSSPWSVTASKDGFLYVVDSSNSIKVFTLEGIYLNCFGHTWLNSLGGEKYIASTPCNKIVVTETTKHRIGVFDENGEVLYERGKSHLKYPRGVTCDQQGNIIVADCRNNQIKIFNKNLDYITGFGSIGPDPDYFNSPNGVSVTRNGDIVVTDSNNNRIQIF